MSSVPDRLHSGADLQAVAVDSRRRDGRPRRPSISYLICTTPRSGSFLLCEALWNTGIAGRPHEYFRRSMFSGGTVPPSAHDIAVSVHEALVRGTTDNGVFGAKVMWNWFGPLLGVLRATAEREGSRPADLLAALFPGLHFVWLRRNDTIRQAISWERAEQSGLWWLDGDTPAPRQEIVFSVQQIDGKARRIHRDNASWERFFAGSGIQPFRVVYEELVTQYEQTAIDIARFLGVTVPTDLRFGERRLRKQSDDQSEQWYRLYRDTRGLEPRES